MGFGLVTQFIARFNTRLVTTLNYSAMANLHTLYKSLLHTHWCSQSVTASPTHFLVISSNCGDSSASELKSFPAAHCLKTELSSKVCPAYNPSAWTNRKHSSTVVKSVLRVLPSNGCRLATCLYATICNCSVFSCD
jgi:hypothetical protein